MKFKVIKRFRDKESKKTFDAGAVYETSKEERVNTLQKGGFIGEQIDAQNSIFPDQTLKHVGGGYYQLPNGEKIKGKTAAEKAFKVLIEKDETKTK